MRLSHMSSLLSCPRSQKNDTSQVSWNHVVASNEEAYIDEMKGQIQIQIQNS